MKYIWDGPVGARLISDFKGISHVHEVPGGKWWRFIVLTTDRREYECLYDTKEEADSARSDLLKLWSESIEGEPR